MTQAALTIPRPIDADGAPPRSDAEAALIERAARDPEAFGVLYRRHFGAVAGLLYRRTGDAALAEDLAADTFLAAWKVMDRYRATGVPFRAWLLRIATNRANAHARRERVRRRVLGLLGASRPVSGDDARDAVHRALACLGGEHQGVVSLVYLEGLSVEQAARVLALPEGTVKSRLHRARAALRRELERHRGDR